MWILWIVISIFKPKFSSLMGTFQKWLAVNLSHWRSGHRLHRFILWHTSMENLSTLSHTGWQTVLEMFVLMQDCVQYSGKLEQILFHVLFWLQLLYYKGHQDGADDEDECVFTVKSAHEQCIWWAQTVTTLQCLYKLTHTQLAPASPFNLWTAAYDGQTGLIAIQIAAKCFG